MLPQPLSFDKYGACYYPPLLICDKRKSSTGLARYGFWLFFRRNIRDIQLKTGAGAGYGNSILT